MHRVMNRCILLVCLFLICQALFSQPIFEFRAAWIATVDNIDWPSKGNFNVASQKAEFISQLDMHKRNGMNAVIVQIRPAADAFYPSPFEPWSEWLTGKQGQPPAPYYDPLQFMIEETHKRGMEFHAWCNPYRAVFRINQSSIAPTHITRIHPEWFLTYGDTKYFDPGNKEVQSYLTVVIRDIVRRYDVDAIHFDDYFYPYRLPGKDFPDDTSYVKYGNGLSREDWRRSNIDSIIVSLSRAIKEEKKLCQFGISPFGVWRNLDKDPQGSDTRAGQTNYDDLYADILLWLRLRWIDYVAPQLYWEFEQKNAPFAPLVDWWNLHTYGRNCYIGLGIYKAGTNPYWRDKSQLPRQIVALREELNISGMIFFSSTSFNRNPNGWNDSLRENYFSSPSLVPPMSWIDSVKPHEPVFDLSKSIFSGDSALFHIDNPSNDSLKSYVIFYDKMHSAKLRPHLPIYKIIPAGEINKTWIKFSLRELADKNQPILISAVGINNQLSASVVLEYKVENQAVVVEQKP